MIGRAALALFLAAASPVAAGAQDAADKVRLDDFALPPAAPAPLQQIAPAADEPLARPQPRDRGLAVPAPPAVASAPIGQIAAPEGARTPIQLAPAGRSVAGPPSLSAKGDSRPQPSVALTGTDRCDPQDRAARTSADCRRILELRAGEFTARQAPVLSAEERLLLEQQILDRTVPLQRDMPARAMRDFGDVDDRASQELASIVLGTTASQQPPAPEPQAPASEAALVDVLQTIILGSPLPTAP